MWMEAWSSWKNPLPSGHHHRIKVISENDFIVICSRTKPCPQHRNLPGCRNLSMVAWCVNSGSASTSTSAISPVFIIGDCKSHSRSYYFCFFTFSLYFLVTSRNGTLMEGILMLTFSLNQMPCLDFRTDFYNNKQKSLPPIHIRICFRIYI